MLKTTLILTLTIIHFQNILYSDLNIYTHRHYDSDKILFQKFTDFTGIDINIIKGSADQLIQRLENEGMNSPADILLTVDAGRLHRAKNKGLLQSISSDVLIRNIPEQMRDKDNYWFGLSVRARVIVYSKERVSKQELSSYEDLANPKWKGRLAIRSSNNIYNQSLLASIIAANGSDEALKWVKSVRENMARKPRGNDRDQIRAVASGIADIGVVNTYYVGLLENSSNGNDVKVAEKVAIFFPNQSDRGTHINVSGGGVTKSSKNKSEAIFFLEFLTLESSQNTFAKNNYEYPLRFDKKNSDLISKWGNFKSDEIHLSKLGENNAEAVKLFDKAAWE